MDFVLHHVLLSLSLSLSVSVCLSVSLSSLLVFFRMVGISRRDVTLTKVSRHCHFCVFQLQNVQVNENVTEDERRFELWYASATSEKYTLQVRNLATKQAWLKDTRELLKALGQSLSGGMDHTFCLPAFLLHLTVTDVHCTPGVLAIL